MDPFPPRVFECVVVWSGKAARYRASVAASGLRLFGLTNLMLLGAVVGGVFPSSTLFPLTLSLSLGAGAVGVFPSTFKARYRASVAAGGGSGEEERNVKWFRGGLVCKAHRLVYHSTLGWRVIKKKKKEERTLSEMAPRWIEVLFFFFFFTLVTGPRRSLNHKVSDARVYESQIRARLGTPARFDRARGPPRGEPERGCFRATGRTMPLREWRCSATLDATQGQMDGFLSQLPYKCHQNRVASVGY